MRFPTLFSILCTLSLLVVSIVGCTSQPSNHRSDSEDNAKPSVFVVSYPLAYFARRIGGELIDVHFPIPPNEDPRFWSPNVTVVNGFQDADLVLINGANFARWIDRVSLPDSKVVNTTENAASDYITTEDGITHQHGPDGEHTHTSLASTTWLDFKIAATQTRVIKEALTERLPHEAAVLQRRFEKLRVELDAFDKELLNVSTDTEPPQFLCAQPVYQYLARRYHLRVECVHWETDSMPSEAAWDKLTERFRDLTPKGMLWETEPLPEVRDKLGRLGIEVIVYDPVRNTPSSGDFLEVMRENVANLAARLR